jgi:hypothetical protein
VQKSRALEAEQWFQRATELAPNDPTVFKHFGKIQHLTIPYCDLLYTRVILGNECHAYVCMGRNCVVE